MASFDFAGVGTLTQATHRGGITLIPLHDELWRVTRASGEVLGYIEAFQDPRGRRFRSKRLITTHRQFRVIGEFWQFDDAVDCLRFG